MQLKFTLISKYYTFLPWRPAKTSKNVWAEFSEYELRFPSMSWRFLSMSCLFRVCAGVSEYELSFSSMSWPFWAWIGFSKHELALQAYEKTFPRFYWLFQVSSYKSKYKLNCLTLIRVAGGVYDFRNFKQV